MYIGRKKKTLKVSSIHRLESFEMWVFRRILKIPQTCKALRRIDTDQELLTFIKGGKTAYIDHFTTNSSWSKVKLREGEDQAKDKLPGKETSKD